MDTENLVPHSGKDNRGIIHWWLKDNNEIIDVTEDSYDDDNLPPYDVGKKVNGMDGKRESIKEL